MDDKESGYTNEQIDALAEFAAQKAVDKHQDFINSEFGCPTPTGCAAGKKHFNEHHLKFDSDIHNTKVFIEKQNELNKHLADKYSVSADMFKDSTKDIHIAIVNLTKLTEQVEANKKEAKTELEKSSNKIWSTLKWAVIVSIPILSGAYFAVNNTINQISIDVSKAVGDVNKTDVKNQGNTELFMAILASKLSGQSVDEIKQEVEKIKNKGAKSE